MQCGENTHCFDLHDKSFAFADDCSRGSPAEVAVELARCPVILIMVSGILLELA